MLQKEKNQHYYQISYYKKKSQKSDGLMESAKASSFSSVTKHSSATDILVMGSKTGPSKISTTDLVVLAKIDTISPFLPKKSKLTDITLNTERVLSTAVEKSETFSAG